MNEIVFRVRSLLAIYKNAAKPTITGNQVVSNKSYRKGTMNKPAARAIELGSFTIPKRLFPQCSKSPMVHAISTSDASKPRLDTSSSSLTLPSLAAFPWKLNYNTFHPSLVALYYDVMRYEH